MMARRDFQLALYQKLCFKSMRVIYFTTLIAASSKAVSAIMRKAERRKVGSLRGKAKLIC